MSRIDQDSLIKFQERILFEKEKREISNLGIRIKPITQF